MSSAGSLDAKHLGPTTPLRVCAPQDVRLIEPLPLACVEHAFIMTPPRREQR